MNNILDFLQIFEDETDNEHMLTKSQILGKLEERGYEGINEKQFYRKIKELQSYGYPVEMKRGKQTKYFMRKDRLTKEEWIFLLTIILDSKDLSDKETAHILKCLKAANISAECTHYANAFEKKTKTDKSKFNQLDNFCVLLSAIDGKKSVTCKTFSLNNGNYVFSDEKQLKPYDYAAENNRIVIYVQENGKREKYFLNEMIDVEIV